MYLHPHTRVHVSSSFHPPTFAHSTPLSILVVLSILSLLIIQPLLPQILSPHRFSKSLHDRYNKEFGIFYPYRINDIFAQQVSRPPSIPSFIEYLYSNLERTKRGYAFLFIYFFFSFFFNYSSPHLPLFIPRYFDTRFNKNLSYSRWKNISYFNDSLL